jgi:ferrous iron transport protein B
MKLKTTMPTQMKVYTDGAQTVALIGNPNCGKTTVFNLLTGTHQTVGNWSGVTVEQKTGKLLSQGREMTIVDLPGVYSLRGGGAVDETIARDYIHSGAADLLINIVDTSNLERQFGLTVELLETGVPVIILLNMTDEAERHGREVDPDHLSSITGSRVLPFVATRPGERIKLLRILNDSVTPPQSTPPFTYPEVVEDGITKITHLLIPDSGFMRGRATASGLIEGTISASGSAEVDSAVRDIRRSIEAATGEQADDVVANEHFRFVQKLVDATILKPGSLNPTLSDKIDRVVLNRFLGVPIFFIIMYLLFVISFSGGNVFLDFIDRMSHTLFVDLPGWVLQTIHAPDWIVQLLATVAGGSIQLVLPFIAPIGFTFLFLTLLEESGYMARGTYVMEHFMRRLGLPGKALVPMVVGFGCNVPAVMATRGIEGSRDRLLVAMMQPFMSCSARLVIYMAFAAVFFRNSGGQVVFSLYLLGIVVAILTALLLGKTVLRGEPRPFLLDLPPYRLPTAGALAIATWHRLRIYLWRVGRVIVTATVCIYVLASFAITPAGISWTSAPGQSVLGKLGQAITPAFRPMGIEQSNWPATVGLLTGAVAKEVVIGTLNGAYSRSKSQASPDYLRVNISQEMLASVATIPVNARALATNFADPLGFGNLAESNSAAAYSGAKQATLRALATHFTPLAAIAYLIFVLLYIPCVSTMGAIRRETGSWRWTVYAIVWGVVVAYGLATTWYQLGTIARHPAASVVWVLTTIGVLVATIQIMKWFGSRTGEVRRDTAERG